MKSNKTWRNYFPSIALAILYFLIGIFVLFQPTITMIVAVYLMGIAFIISGILILSNAWGVFSASSHRVWNIIDGILSVILGVFFIFGNLWFNIGILVYMLLLWFILTSIIQIYIFYTYNLPSKAFSIILNILVIALAIYAFFNPLLAAGVFIWTISLQFIFRGISELMLLSVNKKQ